jgi:hypothetical protein
MNPVKLYDINQSSPTLNSYDHPNDSLSFILNSYKSKINIPLVFHQQMNFLGDYTVNYEDISNMPIFISY